MALPEKDKADKNSVRIQRLQEILTRLQSKEVNPWYHHNSDKFINMLKSIKHAIEYSKELDEGKGSEDQMDQMINEVQNNTLAYIEETPDTLDDQRDQVRKDLALSVLSTVNGTDGVEETLKTIDEALKSTGFQEKPTGADLTEAIKDRMDYIENNLLSGDGANQLSLAEYIVLKGILALMKRMKEEEYAKLDFSEDDLQSQCENVMVSDPFLKTYYITFGNRPNQNVNPNQFFTNYRIEFVNEQRADWNTAGMNFGGPRMSGVRPVVKDPKREYADMKKFLNLDENATYRDVDKGMKKAILKYHPDKNPDATPEEITKLNKTMDQITKWRTTLKENEEMFKGMDHTPSKEPVAKNGPQGPAGPGMVM